MCGDRCASGVFFSAFVIAIKYLLGVHTNPRFVGVTMHACIAQPTSGHSCACTFWVYSTCGSCPFSDTPCSDLETCISYATYSSPHPSLSTTTALFCRACRCHLQSSLLLLDQIHRFSLETLTDARKICATSTNHHVFRFFLAIRWKRQGNMIHPQQHRCCPSLRIPVP